MGAIMIELANVSLEYNHKGFRSALENVNLRIDHERIVVVGPNGSGKTTLIKVLLGLVQAERGTARINGRDVKNTKGDLSVSTNMAEVYRIMGSTVKDTLRIYSKLKDGDPREVEDLVHEFGLESTLEKRIHELSSGEQKMIGNILSLSFSPSIILMDEPFENVDQARRLRLLEIVSKLRSEIMINTHEFDLLNRLEGWGLYFIIEGKLFGKFKASELKNLYISKGVMPDNLALLDTSFGKFSITKDNGAVPLASARNLNSIFDEVA
jgi:ABC-type multidrug transport system ATPase subunit